LAPRWPSRGRSPVGVADLVDAGPGLRAALSRGDLSDEAADLVGAIEGADALIVGSPVYKGAYTGLFKHLFDLIEPEALAGMPVVLTATGVGPRHALVVEHSLPPLFGFFTALRA
jgi:FMN reductase